MASALKLSNPVRDYAWGSRSRLARFLGQPVPSPEPQAEMWMGAHPTAPSRIEQDGRWLPLDEAIARSPATMLGGATEADRATTLPFLLKVLAADQALSIQAHPDRQQASRGCRAEDARGIPRGSAGRNYPDERHKPEILYALEPFSILRGFRPAQEILHLLERLGLESELPGPTAALERGDLKAFFASYMAIEGPRLRGVLDLALERLEPTPEPGSLSVGTLQASADPFAWVSRLERQFRAIPGCWRLSSCTSWCSLPVRRSSPVPECCTLTWTAWGSS